MSTPTVLDAVGNRLEVGSRVESTGFARIDKGRSGTVLAIRPAELLPSFWVDVDLGDPHRASFYALPSGRCPDLTLIPTTDEETSP